jgi:acylglycerol lipase
VDRRGGQPQLVPVRGRPSGKAAPAGRARGAVTIVPGFNSHGGQYPWVADQLVAGGLAVCAVDLRGRGRSEGERFYVEAIEDYLGDVATL